MKKDHTLSMLIFCIIAVDLFPSSVTLATNHKKESDIRLDNAKMLALLSELDIEKACEEPVNAESQEHEEAPQTLAMKRLVT